MEQTNDDTDDEHGLDEIPEESQGEMALEARASEVGIESEDGHGAEALILHHRVRSMPPLPGAADSEA